MKAIMGIKKAEGRGQPRVGPSPSALWKSIKYQMSLKFTHF